MSAKSSYLQVSIAGKFSADKCSITGKFRVTSIALKVNLVLRRIYFGRIDFNISSGLL